MTETDVKRATTLIESREPRDVLPAAPEVCSDCLVYFVDPPSKLCPGCQAYREHQT